MVDEEIKDYASKLFGEMLRKLNEQTLSRVLSSIILSCNLNKFNLDNISDENLAIAIETDKFLYSSSDFMYLYNKPLSLCEYIKKYSSQVTANHATFFERAYPELYYGTKRAKSNAQLMIANVLACEGIDVNIKRKLVEACKDIIQIEKHERAYADYVLKDKECVPTKILWQIGKTNEAIITKAEKLEILNLCLSVIKDASEKNNIATYLDTIFEGMYKAIIEDKKIKIELNNLNRIVMYKLKELKILNFIKVKNKESLWIKAYDD